METSLRSSLPWSGVGYCVESGVGSRWRCWLLAQVAHGVVRNWEISPTTSFDLVNLAIVTWWFALLLGFQLDPFGVPTVASARFPLLFVCVCRLDMSGSGICGRRYRRLCGMQIPNIALRVRDPGAWHWHKKFATSQIASLIAVYPRICQNNKLKTHERNDSKIANSTHELVSTKSGNVQKNCTHELVSKRERLRKDEIYFRRTRIKRKLVGKYEFTPWT